jgi:hypothetical protein
MGSIEALVQALLDDGEARRRLEVDPLAFLAEHDVTAGDLAELAQLVEVATRALPAAERRAVQGLVFVALTAAGD